MPEPAPLRTSASAEVLKVVFLVDRKPDHKDIHSTTPIDVMIQVRTDERSPFFYFFFFLGFNGAT